MKNDKNLENLPAVQWVKPKDFSQGLIGGDKLPAEINKAELNKMMEQDLSENLSGLIPRLPQMKVNHQEASFIYPPDENGQSRMVQSFIAVIFHHCAVNAYWPEAGMGNPPECFSRDGITGSKPAETDNFGKVIFGKCLKCFWNQFGTARDQKGDLMPGKACKNMHRLHLLFKGHALPWRLTLPPTSLISISEFMTGLADLRAPYTQFLVKFELEKVKSDFTYSRVKFSIDSQISWQDYFAIRDLKNQLLAAITEQEVTAEECVDKPDSNLEEPIPEEDRDPDIPEEGMPF